MKILVSEKDRRSFPIRSFGFLMAGYFLFNVEVHASLLKIQQRHRFTDRVVGLLLGCQDLRPLRYHP